VEHDEPVTIRDYFLALRSVDEKLCNERDRRYEEVQVERDKAAALHRQLTDRALELARVNQLAKDVEHNGLIGQLREQRLDLASKTDLLSAVSKIEVAMEPLKSYVTSQTARGQGLSQWYGWIVAAIASIISILQMFRR
jgi:hypothetical protein